MDIIQQLADHYTILAVTATVCGSVVFTYALHVLKVLVRGYAPVQQRCPCASMPMHVVQADFSPDKVLMIEEAMAPRRTDAGGA